MARKSSENTTVCTNRKASFKFELLERVQCGIALQGSEVKSLRAKAVSLDEAYAHVLNGELWLVKSHIAPYAEASAMNHEPLRRRKLLLRARELRKLEPKVQQKGFTLVPTRIYFNERGLAKVEIAIARGKAQYDKRESIKKREANRDIARSLRRGH